MARRELQLLWVQLIGLPLNPWKLKIFKSIGNILGTFKQVGIEIIERPPCLLILMNTNGVARENYP
jgi:hypothetical protein